MVSDVLAPLLELVDVGPALDAARANVDSALSHPALRRSGGAVAAEVGLRSAVASAAIEGHGYDPEEVRAGTVTDPVVQGALRVARETDGLADLWMKVPRQVLARIHVLAARDTVPPDQLGRPIPGSDVNRLGALLDLIAGGTSVPTLLLASVVHGELLSMASFTGPNGVVARAAARITLIAGGLDPRGLLAPEVGHLARQPEYVGAAGAYATGTPDGIRSWIKHCTGVVSLAADDLSAVAAVAGSPEQL
ncbi:oxidoreductase [Rugosimonospora acidiphila]|uniref:oxidoreductase n=1 Tax=Rugosimonospora acidiphila TaxID=556531 RepID=UPI0031E9E267